MINKHTEASSKLTKREFSENRRKFKEIPSISSAGEPSQDVDKAYRRKEYLFTKIDNDISKLGY